MSLTQVGDEPPKASAPARLTKSERFLFERRPRWEGFADMVERARRGPRKLSRAERAQFPDLYRKTCADLAQAKTLKLAPDIIEYLNETVARAHAVLYAVPPIDKSALARFLSQDLPDSIINNAVAILLSAAIFLVPYFASMNIVGRDGDLGLNIMKAEDLEAFTDAYEKELDGRDPGGASLMTAFYIRNNITIAFGSFAGGILAGAGTVYTLVYNGLYLGTVEGYLRFRGLGGHLDDFTTAHSVLELSGLVIAGAAGLCLGWAVIRGGRYRRRDELRRIGTRVFPLIAAFFICIFLAAIIEGCVSPFPLGPLVKRGIAIGSAALLLAYFLVLPLYRRLRDRGGA